jgi:hypothetical protein
LLQAQQIGRLRLSDQHRTAGAGLEERDAAQNQCADDALAEVSFGDDQRAQLFGRYEQRLGLFFGIRIGQRVPAGELAHFPRKVAWS